MATTYSRIQLLSKTSAQYAQSNPVLLDGEIGVADTGSSYPTIKIGDGVRPWSALPPLVGSEGGGGVGPGLTWTALGNYSFAAPTVGPPVTINSQVMANSSDRTVSIKGTGTDVRLGVSTNTSGNAQLNLDTQGVQNWVLANVRADGSFRISGSQTPGINDFLYISNTGTVTIVPISGTGISVVCASGDGSPAITGSSQSAAPAFYANGKTGTNGAAIEFAQSAVSAWTIYNAANTGDLRFFDTADRVKIALGGNVSIAPPTGGIALLVNSNIAGPGLIVGANAPGGSANWGMMVAGTAGAARDLLQAQMNGVSNGFSVSYDGTRMVYQLLDGRTIVSGAASQYALLVQGFATAGQSQGLIIQAGASSADIAFDVYNASKGSLFFRIYGDGTLLINPPTFSASPPAGASGALPATPAGYLQITIGARVSKIPYY